MRDDQVIAKYVKVCVLVLTVLISVGLPCAAQEEINAGLYYIVGDNETVAGSASVMGEDPGTLFYNPHGIATDDDGNIYIADTSRNKIVILIGGDANNRKEYTGVGTTGGSLAQPQGIVVVKISTTGERYIFVADTGNNRVVKLKEGGKEGIAQVAELSGLKRPRDVAADSSNNIYVLDSGNNMVKKYNISLVAVNSFSGTNGLGADDLKNPYGLSVDSDRNIYVADTFNNRIMKYSQYGYITLEVGAEGKYQGLFEEPQDVATDSSGNIYVADTNNNRIQKFSASGVYIGSTGEWSKNKGEFYHPQKLAFGAKDGKTLLYVLDSTMWRVQGFDIGEAGFVKLGPPEQISPAVNEKIIYGSTPGFVFEWGSYPNAVRYKIKIMKPDGTEIMDWSDATTLNLNSYFKNMPCGEYKWKIRAEDANYSPMTEYSEWSSFYKVLAAPVLVAPTPFAAINYSSDENTPMDSLSWQRVSGATGYALSLYKVDPTAQPDGLVKILDNLYLGNINEWGRYFEYLTLPTNKQDTYIWFVTAVESNGNFGPKSEERRLIVLDPNADLPKPTLIGPAETEVQHGASILLEWSDIAAALAYEIQIKGDETDPITSSFSRNHSFTWPEEYKNNRYPYSMKYLDKGSVKFNNLEIARSDVEETSGYVAKITVSDYNTCYNNLIAIDNNPVWADYNCLMSIYSDISYGSNLLHQEYNNFLAENSNMPNGKYKWRVRGFKDIEQLEAGEWSDWFSFEKDARPGPITNLTFDVDDAKVTLHWMSPTENLDGSKIADQTVFDPVQIHIIARGPEDTDTCYYYNENPWPYQLYPICGSTSVSATTNSYTFEGLTNLSRYVYQVTAVDEAGNFGESKKIALKPYPASHYPDDPPGWYTATSLAKFKSATLSWQTVNEANIYEILVIDETNTTIYTGIKKDITPYSTGWQNATISAEAWDNVQIPQVLTFKICAGTADYDTSGNASNEQYSSNCLEFTKTLSGFNTPLVTGPTNCPSELSSCEVVSTNWFYSYFKPIFTFNGRSTMDMEVCAATEAAPHTCDTSWPYPSFTTSYSVEGFDDVNKITLNGQNYGGIWAIELNRPNIMMVKVDGYYRDALGNSSQKASAYGNQKYMVFAVPGSAILQSEPAEDYISNLVAQVGPSPVVDLEWQVTNEDKINGYKIYRYTEPITNENVASAELLTPFWGDGAAVHSYRDVTGTPGATYYYAIAAVLNTGEKTIVSNSVQATVAMVISGTISGGVTAEGVSAVGYAVIAINQNTEESVSTITDNSGNYTLTLTGGTWSVNVEGGINYVSSSAQEKTIVTDGVELTGINFTLLLKKISLTGIVSDGVAGIGGVKLEAHSDSGTALGETDAGGGYILTVGKGDWEISAKKEGYVTKKTTVSVAGTETSIGNVNIVLEMQAAFVVGKIMDEEYNPIAGAKVTATGASIAKETETGEDGSYVLNIGAGLWYVEAQKSGYVSEPPQEVNLTSNLTYVGGVDFVMSLSQAHIRGVVTNAEDSQPMQGVIVRAMGDQLVEVQTLVDGTYDLLVAPTDENEDWIVTVSKDDFTSTPTLINVAVPNIDSIVSGKDFQLRSVSIRSVVISGPVDADPGKVENGDTIELLVYGRANQTSISGRVTRTDNGQSIIPVITMSETPAGSGIYVGQSTLQSYGPVSIKGVVSGPESVVESDNQLYLLGEVPDTVAPSIVSFDVFTTPFKDNINISVEFSESTFVEVEIYDSANNLKRKITAQSNDNNRIAVEWDGTDSSGSSVDSGQYYLKMNYRDSSGNWGLVRNESIVLDRIPPLVSELSPSENAVLDSIPQYISAVIKDNTGGSGVQYVNMTLDNVYVTSTYDAVTGVAKSASSLNISDGLHYVNLSTTDKVGNSRTIKWGFTIQIDTTPPVAEAGADITVNEGATIMFNAGSSYDPSPGSEIASYFWDMDEDGIYETEGKIVSKQFGSNGIKTIGLKVTDNKGNAGYDTVKVTIINVAPVVNAGPDRQIQYGDEIEFTGSFYDPGITDTYEYVWDFGDNTPLETGINIKHRYIIKPGTYTATFRVTDSYGGMGTDSADVTISKEAAKVVCSGSTSGHTQDKVTFGATLTGINTKYGDLGNKTITWTIGTQTVSTITDTSGYAEAEVILTQLPGPYSVEASFNGDDYYFPASGSVSFEIQKEILDLVYTGEVKGQYSDSIILKANLIDPDGNFGDLSGKTITWTIGTQVISASTDFSGYAEAELTLNQIPGQYSIETQYAGNDYYQSASDSDTFTIEKENLIFTYSGETQGQYSDSVLLTVSFADTDGENFSDSCNKTISLSIGSQLINADTENNCSSSELMTLSQPKGDYNLNIRFDGDYYYNPATISVPFSILAEDLIITTSHAPYEVELWAANDGVTVGKSFDLSLTDADSEKFDPLGINEALSLTMDHSPFDLTAKSVAIAPAQTTTGTEIITYNMPFEVSGSYTFNLKFPGNSYYNTVQSDLTYRIIDTVAPLIVGIADAPDYFSPDGNGVKDTTEISVEVNEINNYTVTVEIKCKTSNQACLDQYTDGLIKSFSESRSASGSNNTQRSVFVWNGRGPDSNVVADGEYVYTVVVTDKEGNSNTESSTLTVDVPPIITVQSPAIYFSPDTDGSKDEAHLNWSADQEGYFTFTVYDPQGALVKVFDTNVPNTGNVGLILEEIWSGLDEGGLNYPEGKYRIEITGRDMHSVPDNPCVPVSVIAVLDVTDPSISEFYPEENEFTSLAPKFKINVEDNLAGFGDDSDQVGQHIDYYIDDISNHLVTNVSWMTDENLKVRTHAYPAADLAIGLHTLEVKAEDLSGNISVREWMRFVSIPPLTDDFSTTLDNTKWTSLPFSLTTSGGEIYTQNGKLVLTHTNTIASDDSLSYVVPHTWGAFSNGVFKIARQIVTIEAQNVNISGSGDVIMGGIAIIGCDTGVGINVSVMLFTAQDLNTGTKWISSIIQRTNEPSQTLFLKTVSSLPVDLKIQFEEGYVQFYANGVQQGSASVSMPEYGIVGAFGGSGFREGGNTSSSLVMTMDDFSTNMSRPVIESAQVANADRPESNTINPGAEHYRITAHGTPWQKTVNGRLLFDLGFEGLSAESANLFTVGSVSALSETTEGSGEYVMTENQLLGSTQLSTGGRLNSLVPMADIPTFNVYPFLKTNYTFDAAEQIDVVNTGIQNVAVRNTDYPQCYEYINTGENFRITAQTTEGNWNLKAYIVNFEKIVNSGLSSFNNAIVQGPIQMVKTGDGQYEATGMYNGGLDADGDQPTTVFSCIVFTDNSKDLQCGMNLLHVGTPDIKYSYITNNDRNASDISIGETMKVYAKAAPGLQLIAMFMDPEYSGDVENGYIVGVPVLMEENPNSPGDYEAFKKLRRDFNKAGETVSKIKVVALKTDYTKYAFSCDGLSIIPGDKVVPKGPENAVIAYGVESTPEVGATATTSFTWNPTSQNEDETSLTDLAEYNIYRTSRIPGRGIITPSESLSLTGSAGSYNFGNAYMDYAGLSFNTSPFGTGVAGWFEKGERDLIPLPLTNTDLIDPGKDIYVYTYALVYEIYKYPSTGLLLTTVYSQESMPEVQKWFREMYSKEILHQLSQPFGWGKAFSAQEDGTFTLISPIVARDLYSEKQVAKVSSVANTFSDSYQYEDTIYGYRITAEDKSLNESDVTNVATVPRSSNPIPSANLVGVSAHSQGGYLKLEEEYKIEVIGKTTDLPALEAYLVNSDALASGASFESSIVQGPISLRHTSGNLFSSTSVLISFTDASGTNATGLKAVVKIAGENETLTTDNIIRPNVLDGTLTTNKSSYVSGETVTINYSITNTSASDVAEAEVYIKIFSSPNGTHVGTIPVTTITALHASDQITGTTMFEIPGGVEGDFVFILVGKIKSLEDYIGKTVLNVVSGGFTTTGKVVPQTVKRYSRPFMDYSLTSNRSIGEGVITGVIVPVGSSDPSSAVASFSAEINGLQPSIPVIQTQRFSSVDAAPGNYDVLLYFYENETSTYSLLLTTSITVEVCK